MVVDSARTLLIPPSPSHNLLVSMSDETISHTPPTTASKAQPQPPQCTDSHQTAGRLDTLLRPPNLRQQDTHKANSHLSAPSHIRLHTKPARQHKHPTPKTLNKVCGTVLHRPTPDKPAPNGTNFTTSFLHHHCTGSICTRCPTISRPTPSNQHQTTHFHFIPSRGRATQLGFSEDFPGTDIGLVQQPSCGSLPSHPHHSAKLV